VGVSTQMEMINDLQFSLKKMNANTKCIESEISTLNEDNQIFCERESHKAMIDSGVQVSKSTKCASLSTRRYASVRMSVSP